MKESVEAGGTMSRIVKVYFLAGQCLILAIFSFGFDCMTGARPMTLILAPLVAIGAYFYLKHKPRQSLTIGSRGALFRPTAGSGSLYTLPLLTLAQVLLILSFHFVNEGWQPGEKPLDAEWNTRFCQHLSQEVEAEPKL